MKRLPLDGVRVVDLTMMWAGPYATRLLAEMGADVVKVESPRAWDNIRTLIHQPGAATPWNSSHYFNEYNRDKRSFVVDLADERGREAFLRLVEHSDVVIENYRADVMDRLGLGPAVLQARKPDVICVSMAAFGKTGPDRDLVGFGPVIELMSGACSLAGYVDDPEPYKTGISYGDPVAGVWAAGAVAMALIRRRRTGQGAVIDLSQREGLSAMIGEEFVRAARAARAGADTTPVHRGCRSERWAPQGVYRTAGHDQWLALSVTDDDQWAALCRWLGRHDLVPLGLDERRARHDDIDEVIGGALAAWHPQDAMEALQAIGVPAGRVLDTGDIHDDLALLRRGFWEHLPHPAMQRWKQSGVAWQLTDLRPRPRRHAPLFDEHTREILRDVCGYAVDEIEALYDAGVCAPAPHNPGHG